MALAEFVDNYEDLSTNRGFQFRFRCDRCGDGHVSEFQTVLRIASGLFRGNARDKALTAAVEESKKRFKQCSRCGDWVCSETCWNHEAYQCEECAPDFAEELARVVDLRAKMGARCPTCRASVKGKFCDNCGTSMSRSHHGTACVG